MKLLLTIVFLNLFVFGSSQAVLPPKEYSLTHITNDSINYFDIGYKTYTVYQAEGYFDQYLFDKSLVYLQTAIQQDSLNYRAHRILARMYYNDAIKMAEKEVELENPPLKLKSQRTEYFRLASFYNEKFKLLMPSNGAE